MQPVGRAGACHTCPFSTSRSKDRLASARRRSPSDWRRDWMQSRFWRKRRIRFSPTSSRPSWIGAAGATLLSAEQTPPAAVDPPRRSVHAVDRERLPVRQGQDLRVSQPRRQRAVHLSAPLRSADAKDVAAPDLVIYLQAPTDVLARRLRERALERPRASHSSRARITCAS